MTTSISVDFIYDNPDVITQFWYVVLHRANELRLMVLENVTIETLVILFSKETYGQFEELINLTINTDESIQLLSNNTLSSLICDVHIPPKVQHLVFYGQRPNVIFTHCKDTLGFLDIGVIYGKLIDLDLCSHITTLNIIHPNLTAMKQHYYILKLKVMVCQLKELTCYPFVYRVIEVDVDNTELSIPQILVELSDFIDYHPCIRSIQLNVSVLEGDVVNICRQIRRSLLFHCRNITDCWFICGEGNSKLYKQLNISEDKTVDIMLQDNKTYRLLGQRTVTTLICIRKFRREHLSVPMDMFKLLAKWLWRMWFIRFTR